MLGQAAGFAVLAALSPTAILITTVYLGSARPRAAALGFLAGAILSCAVTGLVLLIVLRSGHLQYRSERTPRYGLRTGIGLLMLAAAAVVTVRKARQAAEPRKPGPAARLMTRMTARPAPLAALTAGIVVFFPSLTFIAAVQVVATAEAGPTLSTLGMVTVVGITAASVWLPFIVFLAMPGKTVPRLSAFNEWLRARGQYLLLVGLAVGGVLLTVNGLTGLTGS